MESKTKSVVKEGRGDRIHIRYNESPWLNGRGGKVQGTLGGLELITGEDGGRSRWTCQRELTRPAGNRGGNSIIGNNILPSYQARCVLFTLQKAACHGWIIRGCLRFLSVDEQISRRVIIPRRRRVWKRGLRARIGVTFKDEKEQIMKYKNTSTKRCL